LSHEKRFLQGGDLQTKLAKTAKGGEAMKSAKPILSVISVFAILILVGIWAIGEQMCVAQEEEEICGTWLNTEYKRPPQKWIFSPGGTCELYNMESSPSPLFEATYTITERWTDSEGNIWYKVKAPGKFLGEEVEWYLLARVSDSGKTLEYVRHPVDYHKELDPNHPSYRVYYRK